VLLVLLFPGKSWCWTDNRCGVGFGERRLCCERGGEIETEEERERGKEVDLNQGEDEVIKPLRLGGSSPVMCVGIPSLLL
jgi:hypothetical protein